MESIPRPESLQGSSDMSDPSDTASGSRNPPVSKKLLSARVEKRFYEEVLDFCDAHRYSITDLIVTGVKSVLENPSLLHRGDTGNQTRQTDQMQEQCDDLAQRIADIQAQLAQHIKDCQIYQTGQMVYQKDQQTRHTDQNIAPMSGNQAYDETLFRLGKLCKRGHEYGQTGKSLRRIAGRECVECKAERNQEGYKRKQTSGNS